MNDTVVSKLSYIPGQSFALQSSTSSVDPPRQSRPGFASSPVKWSSHLRYFLLCPSPQVMLHFSQGPHEVHIGSWMGNCFFSRRNFVQ